MSNHVYNQFVPYIMQISVHLSFGHMTKGSVVEYDGTRVRVNGREEIIPAFDGAIRAGWAVRAEDSKIGESTPTPQVGSRPAMDIVSASDSVVREGFASKVETPVAKDSTTRKDRLAVSHDYRDVGSVGGVKASTSSDRAMSTPTAKTAAVGQMEAPTASTGRRFNPEVVRSYEDSVTEIPASRVLSGNTKAAPENAENDGVTIRNLGSTVTNIRVDANNAVDWDLGVHYKKRVQKALEYKTTDPDRFNRILNVETPQVRAILEAGGTESPANTRQVSKAVASGEDNIIVPTRRKLSPVNTPKFTVT